MLLLRSHECGWGDWGDGCDGGRRGGGDGVEPLPALANDQGIDGPTFLVLGCGENEARGGVAGECWVNGVGGGQGWGVNLPQCFF